MPSYSKAVASCLFLTFGSSYAAEFKMLKAGEWKVDIVESSLGILTDKIKSKPICVEEKDSKKTWDELISSQMKKTNLDCKFKKLKEDAAGLSYDIDCVATEAPKEKSGGIPAGSKIDGTVAITRESDVSYLLDQDSKVSGVKLSDVAMAKVPAEQRSMVEGLLGKQTTSMKVKTKQRYTFTSASCSKDAAKAKPSH